MNQIELVSQIEAVEERIVEERVYLAYLCGMQEKKVTDPTVVCTRELLNSLCREKAELRAIREDEL